MLAYSLVCDMVDLVLIINRILMICKNSTFAPKLPLIVAYECQLAETATEFAWNQYGEQIALIRRLQCMLLQNEIPSEQFCDLVYACLVSARQWYETARVCDRSALIRTEDLLGSFARRATLASRFSLS